ncbi:MAG: hypothetical protein IPG66_06420 [Hydrogenophilales bacterium]|nr:hypothetical protein [Hydrogenophilales bacterium]
MSYDKKHTPGHKVVLVSDEAFDLLKKLQKQSCGHGDQDGGDMMLDLKHVATAVVLEAMHQEGLAVRALKRARLIVINLLMESNKEKAV